MRSRCSAVTAGSAAARDSAADSPGASPRRAAMANSWAGSGWGWGVRGRWGVNDLGGVRMTLAGLTRQGAAAASARARPLPRQPSVQGAGPTWLPRR